ncbi:MAG: T9SS type A sorting domain-containing protein, partial [Calditrichaeota bacterium]|nr:T9SS type A sorting domain-containing protein [Calditrichota bacterium]
GGRAFLPALRADKNVRLPSAQVGGLIPVRLSLYALDGREVLRLHDGQLSPGSHTFALSHFGTFTLPSGIYFLRLQAGSYSRTVKAVLMR